MEENKNQEIIDVEISKKVKKSFLDYAMSVIISRAIPDVYDGLKPVQRRIIYSMYTSGFTYDKPYKKSVRVIGDVLSRFHPHGDSAVYEALVRLAQPFSMRYTLVDGHGNFGSIDGDEAAAHRYTEARLTKLSVQLVRDIEYNVVNFITNYDGIDLEPVVLPSRFPNLLVNGSSGIAVGMATNIPPHNLVETINAVIALAKNPNLTVDEIMQILHGPDFPTGGIILGFDGIKEAYATGTGSVIVRAKTHFENDNKRTIIVVDEIPYKINKSELVKNISSLVKENIIDGITKINDESNMNGIRIAIHVRSDCIPEIILNKLFSLTKLQTSFNIIFLCLEKNMPKIMPIKTILNSYLEYQIEIITNRTIFLKKRDEERKNIILGLFVVIDNTNEIIELIKKSTTAEEAAKKISEIYALNENQVQAILSMTLRRLTGLEKNKLTEELKEIEIKLSEYDHILENRENKIQVITKELLEISDKFGDKRKTDILNIDSKIDEESMIPNNQIVIIITNSGYLKRTDLNIFRTQRIGGTGAKGMVVHDDDVIKISIQANMHDNLLFFSSKGKVYRFKAYKIPDGSKNAKGIPAQNFFNLDKNEKETIVSLVKEINGNNNLTFVTKKGLVKQTKSAEFNKINSNGKIAIKLNSNDSLFDVKYTDGNSLICLATKNGKFVCFNETDLHTVSRNAKGVMGISMADNDVIVGFCTSLEGNDIISVTENGYGKITNIDKYRVTKRKAKGIKTIKITNKNGYLVAVKAVNKKDDLIVITNKGVMIRFLLKNLRSMGRTTQGVRIIKLKPGQKISSIVVCANEDENN